jgi:hypothetical protein
MVMGKIVFATVLMDDSLKLLSETSNTCLIYGLSKSPSFGLDMEAKIGGVGPGLIAN